MRGYKGFDENLKCRGKQYEIGKTYEESEAVLCSKGLHICEDPLDTFNYYKPGESRYAEVEADEVSEKTDGNDSKRVAKKLYIKAELSISGIVKAAVEFISLPLKKLATSGDYSHSATSGNEAHSATSGNEAHSATSGYKAHSATSGDYSHSAVKGKNSIAAALGMGSIASGALGCWIVLAEWKKNKKGDWKIKTVKSAKVDGKRIKPDTFYILRNGKFVEG